MRTIFGAFTVNLAALLVLSSVGCAQEHGSDKKPDRGPRRLESVTWNSNKHELTWVISKGERNPQDGTYKPLTNSTYIINMDKATMTFNGETRGFSKEEAVNVHALLDIVAKYAIESTIWWDQGHGNRVDPSKQGAGVTRVSKDGPPSHTSTMQELLLRIEALEKKLSDLEQSQKDRGAGGRAPRLRTATLKQ